MEWGMAPLAQRPTWRFSAWHLKSPECAKFVEGELQAFFLSNEGSEESNMTLWAACKPSMRGILKGYVRRQERKQKEQCTTLENRIIELERQARQSDTQEIQCQLSWA
ncbi:hypothetical protein NDU88_001573 [Pleurodeles waltl]|uniref:Uncharacterized protein n=1 Tax=Pleurodeles waltl TaxID=8319 RepID=A0AAV7RAC2_PLEWA|nr:hypothetical protein NDU88_001573 [Pleurodeles waltl]